MTDLRAAAQQALEALEDHAKQYPHMQKGYTVDAITALRAALAQQAEPDHETRAELAEQQVVQLAEERDHYRNLWQKAQQAEPVDTDCPTQGICQRSGYGITQQAEPVAGVVLNEEGRAALVEHGREEWHCAARNARRLYTAPPQRKPLTDEEIQAAWDSVDMRHPRGNETRIAFARAIERAHGIKENTDE